MLGLGLGLSKGTNLLSNLKLLTHNADWAIWGDKATGTSKGLNSPATNPIQDLVGNADGTLQGFAFTSASGYVDVVAPNGKTVTGVQGDGANDVILLPSNAPNPVGTQDFGFAFVFKTWAAVIGYLGYRGDGGEPVQWAVYVYSDGRMQVATNNSGVIVAPSNSIKINSFNKLIVKRVSQRLIVLLNGVEIYNQANLSSLVSKPHARLLARTTNVDGTTYSGFSNVIMLYDNYNNGDNIDAWEVDQNKAIAKIYGL